MFKKLHIIFKILDFQALRDIILFANVPSYLFMRFRENDSVLRLANTFSSDELIEIFKYITKRESLRARGHICIYAIIFALTFKERMEVIDFFENLDKYKFEWAIELKFIILGALKTTVITEVSSNNDVNLSPEKLSYSQTQFKSIDLK